MNKDGEKITLQSSQDLKKPVRRRDPKKGRLLLIALCGAVLLAALGLGVDRIAKAIQKNIELNTDHTIRLTDTTVDQVRSIEIHGKTAVTITRRGDTYSVRELNAEVTSQSACEAAFSNAATLLAEGVAAEGVTDFADFGLDDPLSTVRITFADTTLDLEIGSLAPASQHYYVRVDGGDTVYLMRKLIVDMYSAGISAYRDISGFAVDASGLARFTLETNGELFSMQHFDKTGGSVFTPWHIDQPAAANTNGEKAEAIVAGLEGISLSSFVKTARDKAEFGLDAPWRRLELAYADGDTFAMELGAQDSAGNYYACFDGSNDVYLVSQESVSFLDGVSQEKLISEFANIVALGSVDGLTVEMDGRSAAFTIDRSGEEPAYFLGEKPVDAAAFKEAFQAVNIIPINGFAAEADAEGAQAALRLTYAFNNGEEPYTVSYLDHSINNYALSKNGSVSVTVSKEDCAAMMALWRALINP